MWAALARGRIRSPISIRRLFYIFQGFAGPQNKYFVSFFYPVITPYLPMDASQVPADEMQRVNADPAAYMAERIAYLDELARLRLGAQFKHVGCGGELDRVYRRDDLSSPSRP